MHLYTRALPVLVTSLLVAQLLALAAAAQERPPIVITDPTAKRYRVALQRFARLDGATPAEMPEVLRERIANGLRFSGLFEPLADEAFLEPVESPMLDRPERLGCEGFRQIGTDALVQGQLVENADGVTVEFRVLDVPRGCQRLRRKRYRGTRADLPRMGHAIADDIVEAFTGRRGVSDTEIVFVSTRSGNREIWVMDADGGNARAVTANRSLNAFPNWGRGGDSIVYTSWRWRNRPRLFLLTRGRRSPGRILRDVSPKSSVYRGVFGPAGDLAFVMSTDGASELWRAGIDGSALQRLTQHRAIDVSPTWSPDGSRLAFVSDRTGSPQVYVMNADGSELRRLTFDGSYNTAPAWSPDGRWIAYETRVSGQLDLWLIEPDGGVNVPLVTHPRSDESPTWSPDGRLIAFSSNRRGSADIYVVDVTGQDLRRITRGGSDDTSPDWGPWRR